VDYTDRPTDRQNKSLLRLIIVQNKNKTTLRIRITRLIIIRSNGLETNFLIVILKLLLTIQNNTYNICVCKHQIV